MRRRPHRFARVRGALGSAASAALAWLIVASPAVARACAVCVDPEAENRAAFIFTTILLSALPLLLVGGCLLCQPARL